MKDSAEDQVYMYDREEVKILHKVEGRNDLVVIGQRDGYGDYMVARKSSLVKLEDSYEYKRAKERADEIRLITQKAQENLDRLTEKLVDKAIISLASRIKFNVAFGNGGSAAPYAIVLSQELEKMIKKEAPKVIAEKEDVFA